MKIKISLSLTIIILSLSSQILFADPVLNKFLERNKNIKTFQVDFGKICYWSEIDTVLFSYGKLYTKGNNIRLEHLFPSKELMIGTDKELILYFPEQKQLIKQDADYWQSLLSPELLAQKYINYCTLKATKIVKDGTIFIFSTNEEMDDFSEIVIQFSNIDSLIHFFEYKDKYNNMVSYNFSNHIINQSIPDTLFSFQIPDSVNVIDQRILKGDKNIGE